MKSCKLEYVRPIMHNPNNIVYHYTKLSTAMEIFKNGTLRYSSPFGFNDPFEMYDGLIDKRMSAKDARERSRKAYSRLLPHADEKAIKKAAKKFTATDYKKSADAAFNEIKEKSAILCLSEVFNETLMWSHYADKHKGVCVGVYMPAFVEQLTLITSLINYADKIEAIKILTNNEDDVRESFLYWVYTKSKVWQYEREVRSYFVDSEDEFGLRKNGYVDVPFDKEMFVELYYGVSTPYLEMKEMDKFLKDNGYKMKKGKMFINQGTFDLDVRNI